MENNIKYVLVKPIKLSPKKKNSISFLYSWYLPRIQGERSQERKRWKGKKWREARGGGDYIEEDEGKEE